MKNLPRLLSATSLALSLIVPLAMNPAFARQASAAPTLVPLDRIVAVVDEDVIMQSELDQAVRNIKANTPTSPASCRRKTCCAGRCWSAWC